MTHHIFVCLAELCEKKLKIKEEPDQPATTSNYRYFEGKRTLVEQLLYKSQWMAEMYHTKGPIANAQHNVGTQSSEENRHREPMQPVAKSPQVTVPTPQRSEIKKDHQVNSDKNKGKKRKGEDLEDEEPITYSRNGHSREEQRLLERSSTSVVPTPGDECGPPKRRRKMLPRRVEPRAEPAVEPASSSGKRKSRDEEDEERSHSTPEGNRECQEPRYFKRVKTGTSSPGSTTDGEGSSKLAAPGSDASTSDAQEDDAKVAVAQPNDSTPLHPRHRKNRPRGQR